MRPASVLSAPVEGLGYRWLGVERLGGLSAALALDPWDTVLPELALVGLCGPGRAPLDVGRPWSWHLLPWPHVLVSLRLVALHCSDPSTPELANTTGLGEGGLRDHCALSVAVMVALLGSQRQSSLGQCSGGPAVEESQNTLREQSEERKKKHMTVSTDAESVQQNSAHFHGEKTQHSR